MKAVENCENCGRVIGKLEQPYAWRKHVVCAECHVRLSAPAPAPAGSRPSQAPPPPLPAREHFHARKPVPARDGPAPPPVDLRPPAVVAPQAAPMLLCASCGHAYPFGDVVSDHGKVICRTCALNAAAQKARSAARDRRASAMKKLAVAAVVLVVLGGGTYATWYFIRTRPDRTVVKVTDAPPRAADALAEQIMSSGRESETPTPATRETTPATAEEPRSVVLFPADDVPPPGSPATAPPDDRTAIPPDRATASQVIPVPPVVPTAVLPDAVRPRDPAPPRDVGADVARAEPRTPPRPAPPPEGTAERFVYDGRAFYNAGKYQLAIDQFNQAMKKDRNNPDAWHGSGLCLQAMGDRNAALERLEKAVTLYDPPSRAAVYNCAVANLRDNPMRAAKLVKDYLAREGADPAEVDEPLHTVMGKGLFSVGRQGRQNKVYADAEQFFFAYNEKLEMSRTDGRGRWGAEWVPGRDAAQKWQRYRSRQEAVETLTTSVDRATKAKKDAWDKLYDQRTGMRLIGDREQREGQQRYEQAARQEIALRQQLKTAQTEFNSVEKPPFPQIIRTIPMDDRPRSPGQAAAQ